MWRQQWQHPEQPCWGWALAPSRPGGSFSPRSAGHPAGRRSAGPPPGTVPKGGLSCGGSACLRPVIKEKEEGGGCSRHRTRVASGVRECGHGMGGRGERAAFALGDVPSPCLSHFHPPTGVAHAWVLEQDSGVPAPSQRCADLPSSVWGGEGLPSESHFPEGPFGCPQGGELRPQPASPRVLSALFWGFWRAGWDLHEVEE